MRGDVEAVRRSIALIPGDVDNPRLVFIKHNVATMIETIASQSEEIGAEGTANSFVTRCGPLEEAALRLLKEVDERHRALSSK